MISRVSQIVLIMALIAVLGWPALATFLAAVGGGESEGGGAGGGLMVASPADLSAGRVSRPLELASTTVQLVLLTEVIALPIGLPLALILFRTDAWGRRFMLGLLGVAALVPMPLHATSWIGGFGNAGRMQAFGFTPLLVGLPGAAFVHAMAALPWIVLLAGVGLRTVEPELEESALLEMPAWRVVTCVTVRRSVGALAGAALAVAVLTAGDMTVTDLLQVRSYAEEAYVQFQLGHGPAAAAAVALPPLAVLGTLILVTARALLKADPGRLASVARPGRVWALGAWRIPVGVLVAATAGSVVFLPILTLVWRAGRVGGIAASGRPPEWSIPGLLGTLRRAVLDVGGSFLSGPLEQALETGTWSALRGPGRWFGNPLGSPLLESILWGALGATAAVVVAWSLAWLSRQPGPWRWVCAVSVALALATPGPVAGMALVLGYRESSLVYDSPLILVLVFILRTFPYALLVLWPAVRAFPQEHLEVAAIEGSRVWGTIYRVVLPMSRGALIAAWCVAFVLALGELPAANLVAPPGTGLISIEIWSLLHTGVESHLAGVALVVLAAFALFGFAAMVALARMSRMARYSVFRSEGNLW
ncbi:ABC transporter permease [Singulisphaera acidiphila]|uniref:ABC-type Fe3+ transport system, permease component n=1 Tax=Singulisphaera acidiphila (strain ATCC BAA-1392 / DSM 18658 / VKM B-2454 / MOB10) TaxID=886293 RepID=L0DBQ1_SINAD|nr:ABC transporter permease subunit [Singulisphaera acidiphila]AGA26280.1 ABC-type Fe3+ transport system, permease component [Singulisphaera acidiphila DSM 18658]